MDTYHIFVITSTPPTKQTASRVKIFSALHNQSITIPHICEFFDGGAKQTAANYLKEGGYEIIGQGAGKYCWYLISSTFKPLTAAPVKFIPEWTPDQFKAIQRAIVKHFSELKTHKGNFPSGPFKHIDSILGLAYTSSSSSAMYSICNVELYGPHGFNYNHFTIGENGKFYAVLMDKDENERIIEL